MKNISELPPGEHYLNVTYKLVKTKYKKTLVTTFTPASIKYEGSFSIEQIIEDKTPTNLSYEDLIRLKKENNL